MLKHFKNRSDYFVPQLALVTAATLAGIAAVLFSKLIERVQALYLSFSHQFPILNLTATPFLFCLATALVVKLAPDARGSGIPQVLEAIDHADTSTVSRHLTHRLWELKLLSLKTALVKVLSSAIGVLAGASIGREGPTVQIACSGFSWVGKKVRNYYPAIDFQTYLIAGAATGVAAAFNTPMAGITFALEEISEHDFGKFKRTAVLSVIIGGIVAEAIAGDYLYFGHPITLKPTFSILLDTLLIGSCCGFMGGVFSKLLSTPALTALPKKWMMKAFLCGTICATINYFTQGNTAGSGYEITKQSLESSVGLTPPLLFPVWKLVTSAFSYLSGMAGGIFAPSLSIGAGVGFSVAKLAHFADPKSCALIGMVAFFSAVVQAPLTAVMIVMEMADERMLMIPFLLAAILAQSIGKLFMPIPLYRYLASLKK